MEWLKQFLAEIEKATGIKPTAFQTTQIQALPAINYTIYPSSNDGIKTTWRLQTRIVADDLASALGLYKKLETLTTVADETKGGNLVEINGGGTLLDEETNIPQLLTYFDITNRG